MERSYSIEGMTCKGCVHAVTYQLSNVKGVTKVVVDLEKAEASVQMRKRIPMAVLKVALPKKYRILEKATLPEESHVKNNNEDTVAQTKLQQLKPLLLILGYLFVAAFLLHYKDWDTGEAMLDFMGLFFIVFSFFKFLDLKGFPKSFQMYDPLAKQFPIYGWVYPFIELALGLLFLMRYQLTMALFVTLVVLGITTVGVAKTLLDKKTIRCACLGTVLKLPMTEATFIENAIMLAMTIGMLINVN